MTDLRPIDRTLGWMRERGWNQSELARRLQVPPATITNWKNRGMPPEHHATVARLFDRSVDELLGIADPSPSRPSEIAVTGHPVALAGEHYDEAQPLSLSDGEMWLPRHDGVYPRMGRGGMDDGNEVVTLMRVSIDGMKRQLGNTRITHITALRLVTAFGDSMRPTFDDGDMLVVDTGVQNVGQDGVYVLRGPEDILVKRVQRMSDGAWLLISSNAEYQPERIEARRRDEFAVVGRVVFAWRGGVV